MEILSTSSRLHVVAPAIVELGGFCRGVIGHGGGIFQIRGDAGPAKAVIADQGLDAGGRGAPADHRVRVGLGLRGLTCGLVKLRTGS